MTITEIAVWDYRPLFRDGPFVMSHASQKFIYSRIIAITLGGGAVGIGEIVFAPSVPVADINARITDEQCFFPKLVGQSTDAIENLAQNFAIRDLSWRAVAFGLNTAFLDLQARRQSCPLSDLLGGSRCEMIPDYFAIAEKSIARINERMEIAGPERRVIQLKLGAGSIDDDTLQLQTVLDQMNEHQIVLADANGGWNIERALQIIARFDDSRIRWEEPCPTYEENASVAKRSGARIMVDQCIAERNAAIRAISEGRIDSVCIKPSFLGGLAISREIRDLCAEHGMEMRIDGPFCSDVANAAILHLAVGAPAELLISSCDLREPLVIKRSLHGVRRISSGMIAPPTGDGLGIDGVREVLGKPDSLYHRKQ